MRIGLVCPYAFDVPGGVQFHIRDLAEWLIAAGHDVSVLAPIDKDTDVPDYYVSAGGSFPVPYNGSTARLCFGPGAAKRTQRWLTGGNFDVIHIHEPLTPSLGMIALWQAEVPIVATFHSNQSRSRAMWTMRLPFQPMLDKITAPIAVSSEARRTIVEHLGANPAIIPNGVQLSAFAVEPKAEWAGTRITGDAKRPVISFLARLDEPRKGLPVLAGAIPRVLERYPGARFLIAGRGEAEKERAELAAVGDAVTFLGPLSEADKAALFASSDIYVASQTGGESFGIVLVEAMGGGSSVIASGITAFRDVLDQGRAGDLFDVNDSASLASTIMTVLERDPADKTERDRYVEQWRGQYDWDSVGRRIVATYEYCLRAGVPDDDGGWFPAAWKFGGDSR
ncbi:hypothetical protein BSZ39_01670 [Bowdeniella nasicola]|uniref:Glycosyltransferase subfamily 4-like N-terminal domain-containing protein n=1 Tax=Bowdeniella nasicola TaxID=208480 RepID=A0A1Q5Q5L1_9ACTO|nr:glycosyltransferase family 4 protein [Bowdeniella nasicola]OKL54910.1 hypothetical protein BSZ39_01670 [Bowdeniella nasicola]